MGLLAAPAGEEGEEGPVLQVPKTGSVDARATPPGEDLALVYGDMPAGLRERGEGRGPEPQVLAESAGGHPGAPSVSHSVCSSRSAVGQQFFFRRSPRQRRDQTGKLAVEKEI